MANLRVCSLVLLGLFCSATILNSVEATTNQTMLLFAFGDSFVDVGNTDKTGNFTGQAWKKPYGISWPNDNGHPAGRYSDGKTQTDLIKDMLSLPVYPPPYLYSEDADLSSGVNFAVGGSGVLFANNPTSLGAQVDNFERLLHTHVYTDEQLLNSLTIVSVSVEDYLTFKGVEFEGEPLPEYYVHIQRVVNGIQSNLQRLYDIGLRNVMVPNLYNVDCSPLRNHHYDHCAYNLEPFIKVHNAFLLGAVQSINALNPGARFIVLDLNAAMEKLLHDYSAAGFSDTPLLPCCVPTTNTSVCGDVDPATGNPLYTVCKNREKAIFWDALHPTQAGWEYIVNLYANEPGYIHLAAHDHDHDHAPTLKDWLQINNSTMESAGAPSSPLNMSTASGHLERAMHHLLDQANYSVALGLVASLDLDTLLFGDNIQPVTVFVPDNIAITHPYYRPIFDKAVAENKLNEIALYHAVSGYFDLAAIVSTQPSSFTTLSGLTLAMSYAEGMVFVGDDFHIQIPAPDMYTVPGLVAVHGIDHLLLPPGFDGAR